MSGFDPLDGDRPDPTPDFGLILWTVANGLWTADPAVAVVFADGGMRALAAFALGLAALSWAGEIAWCIRHGV